MEKSPRARHCGLSETQIKICQAQIKIMAIILLQALQSSVRPGPRYGQVGGSRLKSGLFNRYVIVGISEVFGHNHADHQPVTQALAHDPSVNYSTAPRPTRRGFKFEKKSRKGCDRFEKKPSGLLSPFRCAIQLVKVVVDFQSVSQVCAIIHPILNDMRLVLAHKWFQLCVNRRYRELARRIQSLE